MEYRSCQEELYQSIQACKIINLLILAKDHMSRDHINSYLLFEPFVKVKLDIHFKIEMSLNKLYIWKNEELKWEKLSHLHIRQKECKSSITDTH